MQSRDALPDHAALPSFADCCFALPSVRTRGGGDTLQYESIQAAGCHHHILPSTPTAALSFILTDYADVPQQPHPQHGSMPPLSAGALTSEAMFIKPEPSLQPDYATGIFSNTILRPSYQGHSAVEQFLLRAEALQQRSKVLWEQEAYELQRGAALKILQPAPRNHHSGSDRSEASPDELVASGLGTGDYRQYRSQGPSEDPLSLAPGSDHGTQLGSPTLLMSLFNQGTAFSPPGSTFQDLVHVDVRLLDSTPTKLKPFGSASVLI